MYELYTSTPVVLIQPIDDQTVEQMRAQITPLLLVADRNCGYRIKNIDKVDARTQSFLWDAEPEGAPLVWLPLDHLKIPSLHRYSSPNLFKPTLAECYSAIVRFVPDYSHIRYMGIELFDPRHARVSGDCHIAYLHLFGSSVIEVP